MSSSSLVLGISTAAKPEIALLGAGHDIALASDLGALESLATLLADALGRASAKIEDISLVGVCTGPGSFTGLRIGVAFAKTLAQVRGLPIAGVSSYDIAAYGISSHSIITVARGKKDYYYARVTAGGQEAVRFIQGSREVIEQAAAGLATQGGPVTIVGPDFRERPPGDAARVVATLARGSGARAAEGSWTNIAIDYGQRPNAVVNWERRRRPDEEGQSLRRREDSRE